MMGVTVDENYRFSSPCDGSEIFIAMRWLRGFHRLLERGKTTDGNKDKQQVFIAMRWLRDFHRHAMAPREIAKFDESVVTAHGQLVCFRAKPLKSA